MANVKSVELTLEDAGTLQDVEAWGGNVHCKVCTYEAVTLVANDVIQLMNVKAGDVIVDVILQTDALGTGCTMDVGDGGDLDRFIDGADTSAGGRVNMGNVAGAITGAGYKYTVDDTIDAKNLGATADGTIKVTIFYVPVGG